jgi:hypothetical protein
MYKSNLLHILLFYFSYFGGLNYSLESRIMIKNFKSGFKILILKKGSKNIKHFFPKMITNLLFYYFHTYETSFFFNDEKKQKKDESRTKAIKNQMNQFLNDIPEIEFEKKQLLMSKFPKLRKSKRITKNVFGLFFPMFFKENDILKINTEDQNYCKFKDESDYICNKDDKYSYNNEPTKLFPIQDNIDSLDYDADEENSMKLNKIKFNFRRKNENNLKDTVFNCNFESLNNLILNFSEEDNSNKALSFISDYIDI